MKTLSKTSAEKAVRYLCQEARPLEKSLYEYHFEDAPAAAVLHELAVFQNRDGGFGHALGPDIRLNDSSVAVTMSALHRMREIGADVDHPVVAGACRYLLDTVEGLDWPIIPRNIDDAPHAPWWVIGGDLDRSSINPRAEIVGYMHQYARHFPDDLCAAVTQSGLDVLFQHPNQMEMHDLMSYIRLWETEALPRDVRDRILDKLKAVAEGMIERDPGRWKEYGLQPLFVVSSPESPFASMFAAELEQNIDFLIDQQNDDGTWGPNWTWGDLWPDVWPQARREWTSVITFNSLHTLKLFGRL
jgi:hypothetical protein